MVKKPKARLDRWATLNSFVDLAAANLTKQTGSASAAYVWLILFRMADGRSGEVRASYRFLAQKTGLAQNTVIAAIEALINNRILERSGPAATSRFFIPHNAKAEL